MNSTASNRPLPKSHQLEPPRECVPASGSHLQPMGYFSVELYQSNYGKAGNYEAGSFVNSAVTALFTKPLVGILPVVGMTPWGSSNHQLHSRLMGVSGIVPGKIMEWPGTVRLAAL